MDSTDTNAMGFGSVGSNVDIYSPVVLINPESMFLKSHILISEFAYLAAGRGLHMGHFTHVSTQTVISGGGTCVLGDFVGLSAGVRLITGSEDIDGGGLTNPTIPREFRSFYRSFVVCERHSFLATNVVVHPGVTIGEGAVVGSGSVVSKDLEPWGIYLGSPPRRIRERPRDTIIELEAELLAEHGIVRSDFGDIVNALKAG